MIVVGVLIISLQKANVDVQKSRLFNDEAVYYIHVDNNLSVVVFLEGIPFDDVHDHCGCLNVIKRYPSSLKAIKIFGIILSHILFPLLV